MARSNYIQSVIDASGEERLSTDWYREKIKEFGTPSSLDLIRDGKRSTNPFFGRMNMFVYGPKHKKTLPYYDTFPLVLPLERYSDGFLGINFHYLPIPLRIGLLNELARYASSDAFDENTMLNVTYDAVKKIKAIKPTLHRYLTGFVKSQFRRIDADEFTVATLLPVQRFKKASEKAVWSDARRMI